MRRPFRLFLGGGGGIDKQKKKQNTKPNGDVTKGIEGKCLKPKSLLLALSQANRGTAAQSRVKTCGRAAKSRGIGWLWWSDGGEDESFVVPMLNELENTIEPL